MAQLIKRHWEHYTTPHSPVPDDARKEYITRIVFYFATVFNAPALLVSTIAYAAHLIPPNVPIASFLAAILLFVGWRLIFREQWQIVRYGLIGYTYLVALYILISYGFSVPATLFFVAAILFAAMVTPPQALWITTALSAIAILAIAYAEHLGLVTYDKPLNVSFSANVIVVILLFGGIGALLHFLTRQFETALIQAEANAQELKAYQTHLEQLVAERTTQLQTEVAVRRETQERLELALEGGKLGSWDWDITTGNVIVNEQWATMLGYSREELGTVTFDTWASLTHPDDVGAVIAALMAYTQNETPSYEAEHRLRQKNGEWLWVLTRGKIVATDDNGHPVRIVGIHQDIDERKRAENALRASERKLTKAQRIAKLGYWEWDISSGHLEWGQDTQQIFGLRIDDFGATLENFLKFVHPDDVEMLVTRFQDAFSAGLSGISIRHRVVLPSMATRMVHEDVELIYDDENNPLYAFGVAHDITEQWQAEEEVKASLAEKVVLLKEIHHRVKNNLQIIASLLYLQSRKTDHPAALEVLEDSYGRVQSMALVHETLYQSGNLAAIEFEKYVHSLTTNLRQTFAAHGQSPPDIQVDIDGITLDIDTAIPCGLVLNELVTNALKYAFSDGSTTDPTVTIRLRAEGDGKRHLVVADNGIGLPDHAINTLTGATATPKGSSLGMSLIRQLSNQLHATVSAANAGGARIELVF